jgi:hypothetical protein
LVERVRHVARDQRVVEVGIVQRADDRKRLVERCAGFVESAEGDQHLGGQVEPDIERAPEDRVARALGQSASHKQRRDLHLGDCFLRPSGGHEKASAFAVGEGEILERPQAISPRSSYPGMSGRSRASAGSGRSPSRRAAGSLIHSPVIAPHTGVGSSSLVRDLRRDRLSESTEYAALGLRDLIDRQSESRCGLRR